MVIERDTDLLTPREMQEHRSAVDAAILEELSIWVKFQAFEIADWKEGLNVMSSKYVAKWKKIDSPGGEKKRIIRMRMTIEFEVSKIGLGTL